MGESIEEVEAAVLDWNGISRNKVDIHNRLTLHNIKKFKHIYSLLSLRMDGVLLFFLNKDMVFFIPFGLLNI